LFLARPCRPAVPSVSVRRRHEPARRQAAQPCALHDGIPSAGLVLFVRRLLVSCLFLSVVMEYLKTALAEYSQRIDGIPSKRTALQIQEAGSEEGFGLLRFLSSACKKINEHALPDAEKGEN